jgi:hypothetical protein
MTQLAENLIEAADHCARLAKAQRETAEELEAISRQLLAKAVEIDTTRQKSSPENFGP